MRIISALAVLSALGCSPLRTNDAVLAKIGEPCKQLEDCAAALVCNSEAVCAPVGLPGTAARTEPCAEDGDCRLGLICGGAGRCARTRKGEVADPCNGNDSCDDGLSCNRDGRCAKNGEPGTLDDGDVCERTRDCGFGLVCSPELMCAPVPLWSGVECSNIEGGARVLFEVPRGGRDADFFRLPFPNDALRTGSAVDLSGHPGLEQFPEPAEAVGAVLSALKVTGTGFGINPGVIFRFSRSVDFQTLEFGGENTNFLFVDVTPGNASRGRRPRARFFATSDRARYICDNWLGIRPSEGTPLEPGHTYAVIFRKGLLDTAGQLVEADDDFMAVMGDQRPQYPSLAAAWDRYQPLKSWLADEGIPAEDLIGGTVFTTGDPRAPMAAMRPAVYAAAAPELKQAVSCDDNRSPCAGTPGRGCGPRDGAYVEVHGVARLPGFLTGVAPFAVSGGTIDFEDGRPKLQRQEEVCVAITVPRRERPVGGWPLAIFAHDSGDHFRSFVDRGLGRQLANQGWAVVSFDAVMQGARSGDANPPSTADVEARLDDPNYPGIMRDHALQASADLHAMVRMMRAVRITVGAANVAFNREHTIFVGHGRGGEMGVPFAAYEPELEAVVLAAAGGSVVDQLRYTLRPYNHGALMGVALAEPHLNGMHPGMHLYQTWLDTRDPMNYATLLRTPPEEVPGKHVFMIYGVKDTVTPARTMNYLAAANRLNLVGPELEEMQAVLPVEGGSSARGNVRISGKNVTQVVKQYAPTDGDGHNVLFGHPQVRTDLDTFLRDLVEDEDSIPTVTP